MNRGILFMKIVITTDSGSGISQEEAKRLGVAVIPMPFMIQDETYFEDVNITEAEFYQALESHLPIHTSQPAVYTLKEIWRELLKKYDYIVHIPISSGLSGTCQSAYLVANEIDEERIQVVDNRKVSLTQRRSVLEAIELVKRGKSATEIKNILEDHTVDNSIYIGLETLSYLKAGGRITPAVAAVGTLLKIKPVLTIVEGGRLDTYSKARSKKGIRREIINALKKDALEKFDDPEGRECYFGVAYAGNRDEAEAFASEIAEAFPSRMDVPITVEPLSEIVVCHTGPGILGAAIMHKLPEL